MFVKNSLASMSKTPALGGEKSLNKNFPKYQILSLKDRLTPTITLVGLVSCGVFGVIVSWKILHSVIKLRFTSQCNQTADTISTFSSAEGKRLIQKALKDHCASCASQVSLSDLIGKGTATECLSDFDTLSGSLWNTLMANQRLEGLKEKKSE